MWTNEQVLLSEECLNEFLGHLEMLPEYIIHCILPCCFHQFLAMVLGE